MRGDGSVAGEGRVVGVPKSHSWGKCIMTLLYYIILYYIILYYIILYYIILYYIILYYIISCASFKLHLGV